MMETTRSVPAFHHIHADRCTLEPAMDISHINVTSGPGTLSMLPLHLCRRVDFDAKYHEADRVGFTSGRMDVSSCRGYNMMLLS